MVQLELEVLRGFLAPGSVELRRVLIHQMRVLGSPAAAKVLNLHNLWQNRLVKLVFQRGCRVVPLENTLLKAKSTFDKRLSQREK